MPKNLPRVLLFLRLSIFLVMLMWVLDKFARPTRASFVYENLYHIPGLTQLFSYFIGFVVLVIIIAFVFGWMKVISYGAVFLLHAFSTLSLIPQYLKPFEYDNELLYAALPMLAACYALFTLREYDTLYVVEKRR
ncbi:MAG: hypothetical protein K940chlam3_00920 [Chlamydiae bacterium]|nr:hypothetical protein [Chlamydiota bacterium]